MNNTNHYQMTSEEGTTFSARVETIMEAWLYTNQESRFASRTSYSMAKAEARVTAIDQAYYEAWLVRQARKAA